MSKAGNHGSARLSAPACSSCSRNRTANCLCGPSASGRRSTGSPRALLMLAGTTRINAALLPGQFGVGSQGGVEPPIHLQRYLARDLNFTKVDYKNAFNSVDISAVINEVRADFPEMDPFVTWAYGTPSMLLLRLADFTVAVVLSGRGVRQGCHLSPLLFSLVMRRIIRAIAEALHDRVVAGSRGIGAPLGNARAFLDPAQAGALVLA